MHIATESNELHTRWLQQSWQYRNRPRAEISTGIIGYARQPGGDTASPLYLALEKAGLIGCIEDDPRLAGYYKQQLDYSDKCGQ